MNCISKGLRALARLFLKRFRRRKGTAGAVPSDSMREKSNGSCEQNAGILGSVVEMFPAGERRPVAASGDRAANHRRSEIDREDGLGKPGRVPCQEGDHVATAAATPAGG